MEQSLRPHRKPMRTVRAALLLLLAAHSCALGGCAAVREYRACGYHGCPADANITVQVQALLAQHPALAAPNRVYVQTLNGVVYLSGQVATELQRLTAESVAQGAPGVRRVVDNVALTYGGR